MERQIASGVGVCCVLGLSLGLSGCVINPYIRSAEVSRNDPNHAACAGVSMIAGDKTEDQYAFKYAECVRRAMGNKAGKYAWMNNAGGMTLIQMAGFAGYSGIRGGHQAQVAAFTTGGASFYGAQQYLYRKPREAIYWSGAEAIGCAIGVTKRRQLLTGEVTDALRIPDSASELDRAKVEEARIRASLGPLDNCGVSQGEVEGLKKTVDEIAISDKLKFDEREADISLRAQRLVWAGASAGSDLITATDAIRETVNGQLAREQPEPAELAKLLATLKLPVLNGPTTQEETGASDPVQNKNRAVAMVPKGGKKTKSCGVHPTTLIAYQNAASHYLRMAAEHDRRLADVQARLEAIESMADAGSNGQTLKYCSIGRTNTLLPFGLQYAQQGVQKVALNGTLSIPITGGIPPYAIAVVSSSDGGITAIAKATDDGGFKIEIGTASSADENSKATFFVNDAVGAGTVFSVEVIAK